MPKVFIGGSRNVSRLNQTITKRLDNIVQRELPVLVGDANGADKAVQRYLAKCGYRHVTVYCMDVCRNNLGSWPVSQQTAHTSTQRRDRNYYTIKDLAMAEDASCGFMLWDGQSKGTLANIVALLNRKKKVVMYFRRDRSFFTIACFDDLERTLAEIGISGGKELLSSVGQQSQSLRLY